MVEFVAASLQRFYNDARLCHCKTAFCKKFSNVAHMLL